MINFHKLNEYQMIAEISLSSANDKIKSVDDIMNFFGDFYANNCVGVVIHKDVLDESFFDLKTGLAGEILQKFTNYNIKLAIIGDFSNIKSRSLKDFIRESNEFQFVNFVESAEKAIHVFTKIIR